MNWVGKRSWLHEDELYSPKRKVSNKGSRKYTHIIGSFPSIKMNRHIGYESLWGECLFYYFLELDPMTIRYYPQPINIQLQLINKDFVKVKKEHVPDVLVFREGKMPHLYQIKGGNEATEQAPHLYKACTDYCNDKGWKYSVIYPKTMPPIVKRNLQSIMHYKHPRSDFDAFSHEIIKKAHFYQNSSIELLAKSFIVKTDYRNILPHIYHLIFLGKLKVNLFAPMNLSSEVIIGNLSQELLSFFKTESEDYETEDK
ncbi:hypothetical protein [Paenibacillus sp. FSL H8-0168]|uniref:hypothetical protein n=1 Tax=Paenibacillus sp. FSL H8-0168 TaxID=2921378 RepID=UPI003158D29F